MTQSTAKPKVILVHGAWADGSSWARVIAELLNRGLGVVAVQNPTTSLADDVAATKAVIDAESGPIVLVGHSWGGAVVTQAGNDDRVKALVYVAAFAPAAGETVGELVGRHPSPPGLGKITDDGAGNLRISVEGWIEDVANDLPEAEARIYAALQPPLPSSTFADKIEHPAWQDRPTWYVVSADDRVVSVELEREMARRMGATTSELASGHLSLLSHPKEIADVIVQAVEHVAGVEPST
jgi:pimeloyl-ACP methyl ester carboxylesterase